MGETNVLGVMRLVLVICLLQCCTCVTVAKRHRHCRWFAVGPMLTDWLIMNLLGSDAPTTWYILLCLNNLSIGSSLKLSVFAADAVVVFPWQLTLLLTYWPTMMLVNRPRYRRMRSCELWSADVTDPWRHCAVWPLRHCVTVYCAGASELHFIVLV